MMIARRHFPAIAFLLLGAHTFAQAPVAPAPQPAAPAPAQVKYSAPWLQAAASLSSANHAFMLTGKVHFYNPTPRGYVVVCHVIQKTKAAMGDQYAVTATWMVMGRGPDTNFSFTLGPPVNGNPAAWVLRVVADGQALVTRTSEFGLDDFVLKNPASFPVTMGAAAPPVVAQPTATPGHMAGLSPTPTPRMAGVRTAPLPLEAGSGRPPIVAAGMAPADPSLLKPGPNVQNSVTVSGNVHFFDVPPHGCKIICSFLVPNPLDNGYFVRDELTKESFGADPLFQFTSTPRPAEVGANAPDKYCGWYIRVVMDGRLVAIQASTPEVAGYFSGHPGLLPISRPTPAATR